MPRKTIPHNPALPSFFSFSRTMLLLLAILLPCGSPASAATWYVKPSAEVPVRSGQGAEFKILAVVPDGMAVEILEEVDPWARIRTPGGTEGWLLKRYLTSETPLSTAVATLQTEKSRLEETSGELSRKYNELSATQARNEKELEACRAERDKALNDYETLRQDNADVIGLQKRFAENTRELQETREKLAALELANTGRKRNSSIMWFLAGGLVLLSGWFLGILSSRSRKRKSTLY
ncbi:MAG TPA: TIGR04211 family SH3 domain-containing protein [Desulfobulbaceae bacterium]|nr:TIGR04211 family SH3 domain-containing protein [Desulfobulbaceae bacterium]